MPRDIFKTQYPIIQAPMAGGILSADFIAQVCNHGLIGFIPAGYLSLAKLEEFIVNVKRSLNSPNALFGVNIFLEAERLTEQIINKPDYIQQIEHSIGLKDLPTATVPKTISEDEYIDLIIKHSVPIISATFGFFTPISVTKLKSHGIKIIANATNLTELEYCSEHSADAVILQGFEAGGHQASFLDNSINLNTTLDLIKQARVLDNKTTLIAAGGISVNNYQEYLRQGADYVQLGTIFMLALESNLSPKCREFIKTSAHKNQLIKTITGKWARGINNSLFELMKDQHCFEFPIQHYLTTSLRQYAKQQDNPNYMAIWGSMNQDNYIQYSLDELINKFNQSTLNCF